MAKEISMVRLESRQNKSQNSSYTPKGCITQFFLHIFFHLVVKRFHAICFENIRCISMFFSPTKHRAPTDYYYTTPSIRPEKSQRSRLSDVPKYSRPMAGVYTGGRAASNLSFSRPQSPRSTGGRASNVRCSANLSTLRNRAEKGDFYSMK